MKTFQDILLPAFIEERPTLSAFLVLCWKVLFLLTHTYTCQDMGSQAVQYMSTDHIPATWPALYQNMNSLSNFFTALKSRGSLLEAGRRIETSVGKLSTGYCRGSESMSFFFHPILRSFGLSVKKKRKAARSEEKQNILKG